MLLAARIISVISYLVADQVSVPNIDSSGSRRQRGKKHPEVCAPKAILPNLRPFPRGLGCFLFWGSIYCIYCHSQSVSGTLEVNVSPAQKVKKKV